MTRQLRWPIAFLLLSLLLGQRETLAQKLLPDAMNDLSKDIASRVANAQKSKIAVLPFRELGGQPTVLGTYLAEKLVTNLVEVGNLDLVERSTLDRVLGELKFNESGAIDPATAKRVGKLVGADAVITGSITDFASFIAVNCRLIDAESGRIFAAAEARIAKDEDVRKIMNVPLNDSGKSTDLHAGNSSSPSIKPAPQPANKGETKKAGPLAVQFMSCSAKELGMLCEALVTNPGEDGQYCVYTVDYAEKMSRVVDTQGRVYTPEAVVFGDKHTQALIVTCTNLPSGVPVRVSLYYSKRPPVGVGLALVEFTFDFERTARGNTWFKVQFRGALVQE